METKAEYLKYVKEALATVKQKDAVASYDTGYGLHIVSEQLGDECHAMDVLAHSVLKIRPPRMDGEIWFEAWNSAVKMVRLYCKHPKNKKGLVR